MQLKLRLTNLGSLVIEYTSLDMKVGGLTEFLAGIGGEDSTQGRNVALFFTSSNSKTRDIDEKIQKVKDKGPEKFAHHIVSLRSSFENFRLFGLGLRVYVLLCQHVFTYQWAEEVTYVQKRLG